MNLTFTQEADFWVSEFTAAADFNLHIEKGEGSIYIYQRTTSEGEYDYVRAMGSSTYDKVVDIDFVGVVYPKWIKVVSYAEPTMAVVTFNA